MRAVIHGGLLVGRGQEQSQISARLADRQAGTAILIRGAAGIGKTALVEVGDPRLKIYPDAAHGFLFQHHAEFAADSEAFLSDPR